MEIRLAREMGFCFGVRRAITMLERAAQRGPLATLGGVVHNRQVVEELAARGVPAVDSLDDVPGSVVAITSHGVAPDVVAEMRRRKLRIVDTTCPFVRRAQRAAEALAKSGFFVVLFGDEDHPEVRGVLGWARGHGVVAGSVATALAVGRSRRRLGVLAQTTQDVAAFDAFVHGLVEHRLRRLAELRVVNTICDATADRQTAALALAAESDVVVVVGGYNSANTRRLAQLCAERGVATHHIEVAAELGPGWFAPDSRVGVTAGASTPDGVIEDVVAALRRLAAATPVMVR